MKIFATCLRALNSLMTYELLASNINARCVHILLAARVHSTRGAHEEFVYIKLFHTYLPSNVTSKSHFLKTVLIRLCAILSSWLMLVTCAPNSNNLMRVNMFLSPDAFIEVAMAATKII